MPSMVGPDRALYRLLFPSIDYRRGDPGMGYRAAQRPPGPIVGSDWVPPAVLNRPPVAIEPCVLATDIEKARVN